MATANRIQAAETRRVVLRAAAAGKIKRDLAKCVHAAERHSFHLACRAKAGITKVQHLAAEKRRADASEALATRAAVLASRSEAATARKAEGLAKRTETAKLLAALGPLSKPRAMETLARAEKPIMAVVC